MSTDPKHLDYSPVGYEAIGRAFDELLEQDLSEYTERDWADLVQNIKRIMQYRMTRDGSLVDRVATGSYIQTLRTRAEMIARAYGLGIRLSRETPATAWVVGKLTSALAASTLLVPDLAQFATGGDDGQPVAKLEKDGDLTAFKTSFLGEANESGDVFMYDSVLGTYTDFNDGGPAAIWPNGTPGDALYVGHPHLAFLGLVFALTLHATEPAVWEYYDRDYVFSPGPNGAGPDAAVVDNGDGTITFRVDTYTGTQDYSDGTSTMEVMCLATGISEQCTVTWDAGNTRNEITTSSYLGQSVVSTSPAAYEIRPYWVTPPDLVDGTDLVTGEPLDQDGTVSWSLPYTSARQWTNTEINGVDAYWVRLRRAGAAGANVPTLSTVAGDTIDNEAWWVGVQVTQGESVVQPSQNGDSTVFQTYDLAATDVVEGSVQAFVAGTEWDVLTTLYGRGPSDQVCVLEEDPDGTLRLRFGNGLTGAIPQTGQAIHSEYRVGATVNGNVGAGTITRPQQTLGGTSDWTNPREATGWTDKDGHDDDDLDRLRFTVPGQARVGDKVVTPEDAAVHAVEKFTTSDGRSPIARADFYESATDAQVLTGYVLGPDGGTVSAADIAEAEEYFNGRLVGLQRVGGVMLANQQVQLVNTTLVSVDVTSTVSVLEGYAGGVEGAVKAALRTFLQPDYRDGGQLVHRNGGKVSLARINGIINGAAVTTAGQNAVDDVATTLPAASVSLAAGELPTVGTLNISVTEV